MVPTAVSYIFQCLIVFLPWCYKGSFGSDSRSILIWICNTRWFCFILSSLWMQNWRLLRTLPVSHNTRIFSCLLIYSFVCVSTTCTILFSEGQSTVWGSVGYLHSVRESGEINFRMLALVELPLQCHPGHQNSTFFYCREIENLFNLINIKNYLTSRYQYWYT